MVQPCFWSNPPNLATQACQGPLTTNDSYSCTAGVAYTVNAAGGVLANDYNFNTGTALTAWLVANPSNGTLRLNRDGSFTYTGFSAGTDTWNYNAFDGVDYSGTPGTVTMTVTSSAVHNVIAGLDNGVIAYSTNLGSSWSVSGVLASGLCCTSLIADDNGTVFAGLSDVWNFSLLPQIWKSTDHGATWSYVKTLTDATDSTYGAPLQIGGGVNMGGGKLMFSAGGSVGGSLLYNSSDNGVTWSSGVIFPLHTGLIQGYGSNRLFNVGGGWILHNGISNSHISYSNDYGSTWTVTAYDITGNWFSFARLANGNILSSNQYALYQSVDNGVSWTSINTSGSAKNKTIISANGGTVTLGYGNLSVVVSTDGGATFGSPVTVDAGQTQNKVGCLLYLHTGVLLAASTHGQAVGTQLAKVYASNDNGTTWGSGVSPDGTQTNIFCLIET